MVDDATGKRDLPTEGEAAPSSLEPEDLDALARRAGELRSRVRVAPRRLETLDELLKKPPRFALPASAPSCKACGVAIEAGTRCDACMVARERDERVARALASVPTEYRQAQFGSLEIAARVQSETAIERAESSCQASRVTLMGVTGAGKTTLVVAMLRARAEGAVGPEERCLFLPSWRLAGWGRSDSLESAVECDVLVLDDLGSDREFPTSPVTSVLFDRHDAAKVTWVTTWMSPEQVKTRYGDGIARRMFEEERAVIIDCG